MSPGHNKILVSHHVNNLDDENEELESDCQAREQSQYSQGESGTTASETENYSDIGSEYIWDSDIRVANWILNNSRESNGEYIEKGVKYVSLAIKYAIEYINLGIGTLVSFIMIMFGIM